MAVQRTTQRAQVVERRPVAAAPQRRAAEPAPSAAGALRERLGNQGAQALIARSIAERAPESIQLSRLNRLPVSKPTDRAEQEAEETARKVVRMSEPAAAKPAARVAGAKSSVQRAPASTSASPAAATASPVGGGAGAPLPTGVRRQMEPRFGASFDNVRVHTGSAAAHQSAALNANAFTIGQHIHFGRDKFQPQSSAGQELIAHELTHTIQQGAAVQRDVVDRSPLTAVREQVTPHVQRFLGIPSVREYLAEKAEGIPGYTLFTVIIGYNPILGASVERNAGNLLRGVIQLIPGGFLITTALQTYGIFDKVSQWVAAKLAELKDIGARALEKLLALVDEAFDHPTHILDVWDRGKALVIDTIERVWNFAVGIKDDIIQLIKDAILKPLGAFARKVPGYGLLCTVLGHDPITGEAVPRDPEALLGGFMKFIHEEELWARMQKANAIPRAFAWFKAALGDLLGFVAEIPTLFVRALKALDIADIILVPRAFMKVAGVFGDFAVRFFTWGATTVWNLLEIIFDVVSPGALAYVKKTGAALKSILRNPLPFVLNLVKAAKLGFQNFATHFLRHLKDGLIDWLVGALPGIYIPKAFTLVEIAKFVFSALGLTWANIREKLVKATSETVVKALETGFDIVVTLVRDGPAAAWDKIKDQLSNLKDMVIGGIIGLVVDTVVKRAIPKLTSMFIPGLGFISAILSIYDTIKVFINKLAQIATVVTSFIDSIVAIAGGAIGTAATRVENALAGFLSLAINFLAAFASLGNVADKVMAVIARVRDPIDKALDWLINWIVTAAKNLGKKVAQAGVPEDPKERFAKGMELAVQAVNKFAGKKVGKAVLTPLLTVIKVRYGFTALDVVQVGPDWWVEGSMSPSKKEKTNAKAGAGGGPKDFKVTHTTSKVGGHTVGVAMTADWLDETKAKGGSKPESGEQEGLMNLLITNPSESSTDKFIRGHLLNEHLGGPGTAKNMFPITGNANSQHLHSTEKTIKGWMKKPDRWTFYEVKVTGISSKLDAGPKNEANYVEATFECHAMLKDESGKAEENFSTTIPSVYGGPKQVATRIDHGPDKKK